MPIHTLYLILEGPGLTPQSRSRWSLAFHNPNYPIANIYQALLLDDKRLIHHLDVRTGVPFPIPGCEGAVRLVDLDTALYTKATGIIAVEPPPRNSIDRCQDWTLNCIVALEVEEVLEPGMAELVGIFVRVSAEVVKVLAGE